MINREMANAMVNEFEMAKVVELNKMAEDFCENEVAPKIEAQAKEGKRVCEMNCPIKIAVKVCNYLRREGYTALTRCFNNENDIIEVRW